MAGKALGWVISARLDPTRAPAASGLALAQASISDIVEALERLMFFPDAAFCLIRIDADVRSMWTKY